MFTARVWDCMLEEVQDYIQRSVNGILSPFTAPADKVVPAIFDQKLCVGVCDAGVSSYQGLVGCCTGLRGECGDSSSNEAEISVGLCCHLFHLFVPGEV